MCDFSIILLFWVSLLLQSKEMLKYLKFQTSSFIQTNTDFSSNWAPRALGPSQGDAAWKVSMISLNDAADRSDGLGNMVVLLFWVSFVLQS